MRLTAGRLGRSPDVARRERPGAEEGMGAGSENCCERPKVGVERERPGVEVIESGKNDSGNGCLGAYMDGRKGRGDRSMGREVGLSGGAGRSPANPRRGDQRGVLLTPPTPTRPVPRSKIARE